jgi:hypothetical protein
MKTHAAVWAREQDWKPEEADSDLPSTTSIRTCSNA